MSTWYESAVFYHMYPLGMTGAPKVNTDAESGGRFEELNRWVMHISELNCSAVYIGPLFESRTHGYDTMDFRKVDRRLGTNEDFRRFVFLCHESGIRVVVDGVFNHTGRDFFAFQDIREHGSDSRYTGWYRGLDFGWGSPMGDPFGYECWRGIWELPCLNLQNPEVKEYLFDAVRFWVEEFDIDGIRLDCAGVLDFQFMKELRALAGQLRPDFWLMGEVIHGEYARWVNSEMLHSVTNYEMHKSIYSAHNDHNYFELAHNVRRLEAVGGRLYTFVDNHDEDRIAGKLNDPAHLCPVYTLLYTLPGIPSVYYGSEWGINGHRSATSDEVLRPRMEIGEWAQKKNSLTELIALLGRIHREEPAFHGGTYEELLLTNRQYAFARFPAAGAAYPADGAAQSGRAAYPAADTAQSGRPAYPVADTAQSGRPVFPAAGTAQSDRPVFPAADTAQSDRPVFPAADTAQSDRPACPVVTAANNGGEPAVLSIPWSRTGQTALDLLTGTAYEINDGHISLELPANRAAVLKIT